MSSRRRGSTVLLLAGLIGWSGSVGSGEVHAQASALDRVERLAAAGRIEEARGALVAWWDSERVSAPRVDEQRGLWLRARLTVDPEQAMLDYRRLVLLYPAGPYTDQALFRLAQAAHIVGDDAAARAHVAALVRDHPDAPSRRAAEAWLADAEEGSPRDVATGSPAVGVAAAMERPAGDGERAVTNVVRAAGADIVPASTGAASALGSVGTYSVQLGAFGDPARARAVLDRAIAAGLDPRIVRVEGSDLLHVRLGSYAERAPAQEILDRIGRLDIDGAVVRDDRSERAVPTP